MADVLLDKTKQGLAAFVRSVMSRTDYYAMYACVVTSQNGDSTLELKPDSARLPPGLSRVPLRLGIPGCTVTVNAGSRVLLGWYEGNPSKPFAALFESSSVAAINLNANAINLNSGSNGVARAGDPLSITATVTTTAAAGTWNVVFTSATIQSGSSSVKAG